MFVHVYWNLHKDLFSVRHKGKVITHQECVVLAAPTFHVNENGRQRVLEQKKKNVHAYVKGEWLRNKQFIDKMCDFIVWDMTCVTYNPYKMRHFKTKKKGKDIITAPEIVMFIQRGKPVMLIPTIKE